MLVSSSLERLSKAYFRSNLIQCRNMSAPAQHFDVIVIGGGSGGLAFAKRSAGYGAKVCVIENKQYGGTCVNVGCVPKKIMYTTSHVREAIHEAYNFG